MKKNKKKNKKLRRGVVLALSFVSAINLSSITSLHAATRNSNYFLHAESYNNQTHSFHHHSHSLHAHLVSSKLGWVHDVDANNLCYGYFLEPMLDASGAAILPPKQSSTTITAEGPSTFSRSKPSVLKGHVIFLQPGRRVTADKAVLYRDPQSGKYKILDLYGNVHAYEKGKLVVGDYGHFDMVNKTSVMKNVFYRVSLAPNVEVLPFPLHPARSHIIDHAHHVRMNIVNGSGWGHAALAVQTRPGHTLFRHVTYSTCAPDRVQWHIMATKLKLNKESGRGTAHNAMLFLGGVPVFYSPYFNFPISRKRKTGFLYPTLGYTSKSGAMFGLPFYWNIAPNYDDTITPILYSKRGVLFKNLFRYLTSSSAGYFNFQYIHNDREFSDFRKKGYAKYSIPEEGKKLSPYEKAALVRLKSASNNRYLLSWKHDAILNHHWSAHIDYAHASDDYYLQDFGNLPEEISTNELLQRAGVYYRDEHWNFSGLVQHYQVLHPVNRVAIHNVYTMLPQLNLSGHFPNALHGLDLLWNSQITYFTRTLITPHQESINGTRVHLRPGVSLPLHWIWGYFKPTVQMDVTHYALQNQIVDRPDEITRTMPMINVHAGIYFEKQLHLHGHNFLQTLEPEIYYLYVPYHDQRAIPTFDSGIVPFGYAQLFSNNRFSGLDRIGDANQLSLALTTRIINNETGIEKFRFSIGQIYYFRGRKVMFCGASSINSGQKNGKFLHCDDFTHGLGAAPNDTHTSPVAALTSYHFNRAASINGAVAWDFHIREPITGSFYYSYSPALNHILNVGYSFIRNGSGLAKSKLPSSTDHLSQIFADGSWPLTNHWSLVGIVNYNISQQHAQTYLAGIEYNSCCLRIRFVGGRTFSNFDQNNNFVYHNAFYLQVALKGLANLGTNSISNILSSSIPGYVDPYSSNHTYF